MKNLFILAVALIFPIVFSACGSIPAVHAPVSLATVPASFAGKANPLGAEASIAGAGIFKVNCASCHGDTGLGDGAAGLYLDPRPVNLVKLNPAVADDYLYWRINTGMAGTSMISWKGILNDQQIWQVIAFIRTFK